MSLYKEETHLTVHKTSRFFPGDGFTVYNPKGELVFRVDSYRRGHVHRVLMDPDGRCILTVSRKRTCTQQWWEGFIGESTKGKNPHFSVSPTSKIGRSNMKVYIPSSGEVYEITGSFADRKCTIENANMKNLKTKAVAEIRRKVDLTTNVMLGKDVFLFALKLGFDSAFAMALVLVLDQIHGGNDDDD